MNCQEFSCLNFIANFSIGKGDNWEIQFGSHLKEGQLRIDSRIIVAHQPSWTLSQSFSSLPSRQSTTWSHTCVDRMHLVWSHWNSVSKQRSLSSAYFGDDSFWWWSWWRWCTVYEKQKKKWKNSIKNMIQKRFDIK